MVDRLFLMIHKMSFVLPVNKQDVAIANKTTRSRLVIGFNLIIGKLNFIKITSPLSTRRGVACSVLYITPLSSSK